MGYQPRRRPDVDQKIPPPRVAFTTTLRAPLDEARAPCGGSYFPYPNRGMFPATRYDGSAYHRALASATRCVGPHHVTSPVGLLTTAL